MKPSKRHLINAHLDQFAWTDNPYWSAGVSELTPYIPGEQPKQNGLIKLNTNENPFGPSPHVLQTIQDMATSSLRLYPDPESIGLRTKLADHHGLKISEIFVGNGSDEVLALAFRALLKHKAPILFPDVTYSFYQVYCKLFNISYAEIPLNHALEIRAEEYARPCGGIILPNPNAPTGIGLPLAAIEKLLSDHPYNVVVVDEAYIDFGGNTAIPLIKKYPNLLVVRTFSKSRSLAGLRIGFAVGNPVLIEALVRVKNSFNSYPLDRLAEAAAIASYDDHAYFERRCSAIIRTREILTNKLKNLGFEVLPSIANFVFSRLPGVDAAALCQHLRDRGILVRHFDRPRIHQYLRITVGSPSECRKLLYALESILCEPDEMANA